LNSRTRKLIPLLAAQITVAGVLLLLMPAGAAEVFQSGNQRVHVLELYTSEGCSSCPPADRWLSGLLNDQRLWHRLVPAAFHVDYWNDLGWPDRFALPVYSERQRRYARNRGNSTVYTPAFFLNGREWRSFFGLRRLALDSDTEAGNLAVTIKHKMVQATYLKEEQHNARLELNLAILGFDLNTRVQAGENRGKKLQHDFAVLAYKSVPLKATAGGYNATTSLPDVAVHAPRTGLAAWISNEDDPAPVQATGGWIELQE